MAHPVTSSGKACTHLSKRVLFSIHTIQTKTIIMKHLSPMRHFLALCLVITGFLIPSIARAQTPITITGPNPGCLGSVSTYTFTPPVADLFYTWSVTAGGSLLTSGTSSAQIQWIAAGPATITVTGKDSLGAVIALGNLTVTVNNLPNPVISASTSVNCMPLDDPDKEHQKPVKDTSDCLKVCEFSPVTYTVPNNPGSTYTWVISGDVSSSASGNTCNVNWGAAGVGSVTVTETRNGCSGTTTICIKIIEGPKAKFYTNPNTPSPTNIVVCKDATVFFFDISTTPTGSPLVSWAWDFGDGSYSSAGPGPFSSSVSHQYTVPGVYTAALTVTNSCGCSSTYKIKVTVKTDPGVKIDCPRVVCERERATYFVDQPCSASAWSVIGGSIVATTPDRLDVVWDAVGADGFGYVMYQGCGPCPGVTVVKVPVVKVTGTIAGPTTVCPNKQYLYSMPQWPTTDFEWTITGNGTINPTDQPNEIAVTAGASGSYTITVKYCNTLLRCTGSATLNVTILPPASISGPKMVCKNDTKLYTLVGAASATWTLTPPTGAPTSSSGSSFSPTFTQVGTYTLSISGPFCPPDPIKIKVVDKPAPPNFILGPNAACAGVPVQYTAGNPLAGTLFQWSVSAPGTVNNASGNSTYATFGGTAPYTISVVRVTTDEAHCVSNPISKVVTDPVPPLVMSGPDTVCGSTDWDYALNYTGGDIYEWKIVNESMGSVTAGDGSPSVHVLWNNPPGSGTMVKLIVKMRKCLNYYYDTMDVYVMNAPILTATASPTTVCAEQPVTFNVTGSPALTSWTSVSWNFGDGTPAGTTPSLTHAYSSTGGTATYNPTVTVVGPNGCINTSIVNTPTITVLPTPVAYVSPAGPLVHCGGFVDNLNATVTTGFGSTTNYQWFGPTTSPAPPNCGTCNTWNVNTYGNYFVIVKNSNGCSDTSNIVKIIQNCGTPCTGPAPILISDTAYLIGCGRVRAEVNYNPNGTTILSQSWTSTTGGTFLGQNLGTAAWIEMAYPLAGSYLFNYNITYNNGINTCSVTYPVSVIVPYMGDLYYSISCGSGANYNVTLLDHSNIFPMPQTINHFYSYKLSSASTYTSIAVPTSALSATVALPAGTYDIREIINNGTTAPACTTIRTIVIPPKPVANFNVISPYMPACQWDVNIHFQNTTTPTSGLSYSWSFGDGATNYQKDVDRVYNLTGLRTVTLTVKNEYGCTSTISKQVNIVPNNLWDRVNPSSLTASPTAPCQGTPVTLTYAPLGAFAMPTAFTWYNESTVMPPVTSVPTYTVLQPGGYWTLGMNGSGCKAPSDFRVVNMVQVPPAVINGLSKQCHNEAFTLNGWAGSDPNITYEWHLNGGPTIGTGSSLSQTLPAGTYNYTLVVKVPNGMGFCSNTSTVFTVNVYGLPPSPSISSSIVNCAPYQIQLNASSGVPGTFNWSNGAIGSPAYGNAGGYYLCTLTDTNGCTSQSSLYAEKDPSEYLWIFPTGCFCKRLLTGGGEGPPPYPVANCRQNPRHITGPIIPFSYWAYLYNGSPNVSGSGLVPDYFNFMTLGDGTYNLVLKNSACAVTSGNMYIGGDYCSKIGMKPGEGSTGLNEQLSEEGTSLLLIPNPARAQTVVDYLFSAKGEVRYIEVHDMVGRLILQQKAPDREGTATLQLDDYAAGMYQVTLREDGRVIQQRKLSVTK